MVIEGVRCVMRISGISLKNGSRPLWKPSYSNDRHGFQVEARSATVARDTRRRWFGGAARGDRSSRGKKATAAVAGSPSVRKPLLRDTDGRYPGLAEAARKHVERRTETERRRCQLRDRARVGQPPTFAPTSHASANFYASGIERVRDSGVVRMDVSSSRLFANFGNIRSSALPSALHFSPWQWTACRIPNGVSRREVAPGPRKKAANRREDEGENITPRVPVIRPRTWR